MPWNIILGPILIALILGIRNGLRLKTRKQYNRPWNSGW